MEVGVRGRWRYNKETRDFEPVTGPVPKVQVHFVQTDEIPETMSHATDEGLVFTSKAKLFEHYKRHGFHVKEKGEEPGPRKPYKPDREEIKDTIAKKLNDLRWGNIPVSEQEKETCRREERAYQEWKRRNGY